MWHLTVRKFDRKEICLSPFSCVVIVIMKSTTRELTISDELFYEGRELRLLLLPNVCRYANFDNRYGSLSLSYWNYWITFSSSISFRIKDFWCVAASYCLNSLPASLHYSSDLCCTAVSCNSPSRLNNLCVNCIFSECDHFKLSFCRRITSEYYISWRIFLGKMQSIVNFTFTLVNFNCWHFQNVFGIRTKQIFPANIKEWPLGQ